MDICATVVSSIVASIIAATVAWLVGCSTIRAQSRQSLRDQVDRIVDLGITYPRLENDPFCQQWDPAAQDEESMRYDSYCCQVFNLLERLWKFSDGSTAKMREFIYFEELLFRHKGWWYSQLLNKVGYEVGFREFIESIVKGGSSVCLHEQRF